jgi:signal peptidase I
MNWENIVLIAAIACAGVILWDVAASLRARMAGAGDVVAGAPPHTWLEIAYPLGFIALMGLLVVHSVMSFAAILLLATVITGVIWAADRALMAKKRASAGKGEPVLVEMAKSFFPVILVVFLLRSFLVEPFKIPSGSMLPSLQIGDFILVNKFTYGVRIPVLNQKVVDLNQPKRGEVMVFRYPEDPSKDFIKRIVGLPGDTVSYRNKRLTINGQAIATEQIGTVTEVDERSGFLRYDAFREKLGDKSHVMMVSPERPTLVGSGRQFPNRKNCEYNEEGVTCKVPAGHYFMMGDNRDNSDDSRYWGFVPDENIVGKAFLVWMNFGNLKRIGTSIE